MMHSIEAYFDTMVSAVHSGLSANEQFTCFFSSEQSDFVRLNHARIRQAGSVEQAYFSLELIAGRKHASARLTLTLDRDEDQRLIHTTLGTLRAVLGDLVDDPLLELNSEVVSSRSVQRAVSAPTESIVESILALAAHHDLVGFLANGPQQRGFANSFGQRNWHEVASFNLEWSLYHQADRAVKSSYAGFAWDERQFQRRMQQAQHQFDIIQRPLKRLSPGHFRAFFAPAALAEVMSMMSWGGFSEKACRTRQSPLQKLAEGQLGLHPMLDISEHTAAGLAPVFQMEGYRRPDTVQLIAQGQAVQRLISPRTAREYGLQPNGADIDAEQPQSIDMAGGSIAADQVLDTLECGLYLNHLWYLNFSDRMNCRLTGMTRFAAFWVEHGEIVAPCEVMRFDDSVYRMLGSNLIGLTAEREFMPDSSTYNERMTSSQRLPGALIDAFCLTL